MATVAEAFAQAKKSFETGDSARAEFICRQIVAMQAGQAAVWFLLASACEHQGKVAEAGAHYRQVIRLLPDCAEAHTGLGNTYARQGQPADAEKCYREAVRLRPSDARTHYNLGVVATQQGNYQDAITHYQEAVRLDPKDVEALSNLGNVQRLLGQAEQAVASQQQALQLQPNSTTIINNLAATLVDVGRLDEAIGYFHQALRMDANLVECYNNIGQLRKQQGRLDEALANFEHALRLVPDHAAARWNRALIWLLLGDWQRGWPEYEWRWHQPGRTRPASPQPLWDGAPLNGRTILLGAEQGLGDTIQFIRYAALIKERGGNVIVECPPTLMRLLAGVRGIDQMVLANSPQPPHHVQAPLLSLPGILGTSVDTIPTGGPYLSADTTLMDHWNRFLTPLWGFKVGIAWQGNPRFCDDRQRSIPLSQFSGLASINGVRLISLQKGPGVEQLREHSQVMDLGSTLDEANGPFMDSAAIMKHLDLVICSDSAVAHLAGALGVPVWLALPLVPDWRWLLEREDTPWYPTMRLFRQKRIGDWDDVFRRIGEELRTLVEQRPKSQG
ncbi:MAG TPA: tetratricopeptide repeat protein [Gemmataceae bacterium]|nr:tetratricopeptide repeat protein [Gemmataceae bacterium]